MNASPKAPPAEADQALRQAGDLTIVTVCTQRHYSYIPQQIRLLDALNPGARWKLIVVDNGEPAGFVSDDPRCIVIPGVAKPDGMPDGVRGSYHHALALNLGVRDADTRFVLVLDPDLFVVSRNWIRDSIEHLVRGNLTFFGVPWNYRWHQKYRYFPCVHCVLIDQEKLRANLIDFTPEIVEAKARARAAYRSVKNKPAEVLRNQLGASRDTGWRLYYEFGQNGHRGDVALPVVDVARDLEPIRASFRGKTGWLQSLLSPLPDITPREGAYVDAREARWAQQRVVKALEAELFEWRGAPFAVHLRGAMQEPGALEARAAALGAFLDQVASSPSWLAWGASSSSEA